MPEFLEQIGGVIKKHGLDMKVIQPMVKETVKTTRLGKLDKAEQEKAILEIVDLSGREKIEIHTAWLLWDESERSKKSIDDVVAKFKNYITKDFYKSIPKAQAERYAMKAVRADLVQEKRLQTRMFNIVVLGKSSPKNIKMKKSGKDNMIANLAAYCTMLDGSDGKAQVEPFYRSLAFWGEQCKQVKNVIIGHQYHANFSLNRSSGQLDAWGPVEKTEFIEKGKFMEELVSLIPKFNNVKKITLNEAEFNLSVNNSDYRCIKVDIVGRVLRDNASMYFVADETIEDTVYGGDENNPGGGFTVFMDPQNMIYGDGSEVYIIGTISKRVMKDGKTSFSMNGHAVLPIFAVPVDMEPVENESEVNMRSGDAAVVDPSAMAKQIGEPEPTDVDDMFDTGPSPEA